MGIKINFVNVDVHNSGLTFIAVRRGEKLHYYGSHNSQRLERGIKLLRLFRLRRSFQSREMESGHRTA